MRKANIILKLIRKGIENNTKKTITHIDRTSVSEKKEIMILPPKPE